MTEAHTEIITHTLESIQTWRQVGWQGFSGKFYNLADLSRRTEKGGYSPVYILAHNECYVGGGDD